jgi:hypothetical protein
MFVVAAALFLFNYKELETTWITSGKGIIILHIHLMEC